MRITIIFIAAMLSALLVSCNNSSNSAQHHGSITSHASLLCIMPNEGYTLVTVADPWNEGQLLDSYVLVPRDSVLPEKLPAGKVIRTPLESSVVYSSAHACGINDIGALSAVTGVTDAQYFSSLPTLSVIDLGPSLSPSIERLITLAPEASLLSPYQNSGFGEIANTGIPIIQMADYMENTPLGRAEWILFLGELYGRRAQADSIFAQVKIAYSDLCAKAASATSPKPKVLTEQLTSGVWYVPGGRSYMAHLLTDAGGVFPWADDDSTGSLQLSAEEVLVKAADADVWLLRTYGYSETKENMLDASRLYSHFKAFADGNIFCCNTAESNIFDVIAFHPEAVLADFISIFHPEVTNTEPTYYKRIDK